MKRVAVRPLRTLKDLRQYLIGLGPRQDKTKHRQQWLKESDVDCSVADWKATWKWKKFIWERALGVTFVIWSDKTFDIHIFHKDCVKVVSEKKNRQKKKKKNTSLS